MKYIKKKSSQIKSKTNIEKYNFQVMKMRINHVYL